jgi:hypothetical protein
MNGFEELEMPMDVSRRARRLSNAAAWERMPVEDAAARGAAETAVGALAGCTFASTSVAERGSDPNF